MQSRQDAQLRKASSQHWDYVNAKRAFQGLARYWNDPRWIGKIHPNSGSFVWLFHQIIDSFCNSVRGVFRAFVCALFCLVIVSDAAEANWLLYSCGTPTANFQVRCFLILFSRGRQLAFNVLCCCWFYKHQRAAVTLHGLVERWFGLLNGIFSLISGRIRLLVARWLRFDLLFRLRLNRISRVWIDLRPLTDGHFNVLPQWKEK